VLILPITAQTLPNLKALWHFLLDTTVSNCYKLSPPNKATSAHHRWIEQLSNGLLIRAERSAATQPPPPPSNRIPLSDRVRKAVTGEHYKERLERAHYCVACSAEDNLTTKKADKRKVFGNLSHNSRRKVSGTGIEKRRERYPRSIWGCGLCRVALCR
jgi:hypothetical protein